MIDVETQKQIALTKFRRLISLPSDHKTQQFKLESPLPCEIVVNLYHYGVDVVLIQRGETQQEWKGWFGLRTYTKLTPFERHHVVLSIYSCLNSSVGMYKPGAWEQYVLDWVEEQYELSEARKREEEKQRKIREQEMFIPLDICNE